MVSRMTARELAARLDNGDDSIALIDTRPSDSFEGWHVHGAVNVPFHPAAGFDEDYERQAAAAANGHPVVVMCGKGFTSAAFALHLADRGFDDVAVVEGGMAAWGAVHEHVPIDDGEGALVVRQVQRRATGCLGYVVGSRSSGEAVVVDPTRQTDEFAVATERAGLTVTAVVDTHVHADHVSGGPALADELDVPYYLGADVEGANHGYDSLADGEALALDGVEVRVLCAPGHTEEMIALLVDDEYLLSADALFVDSVGRTELAFGEEDAERGADMLYDTLHDVLLELDDGVTVLPGHVSVTEDNRYETGTPGEPIRARLGDLKRDLDLLSLDREAFVDRLTGDLPDKPTEYERVIAVNAGEDTVDSEEEGAELDTGPNNCSA